MSLEDTIRCLRILSRRASILTWVSQSLRLRLTAPLSSRRRRIPEVQNHLRDHCSQLTIPGCVTVGTCTSQLLYEIQGPLYYNCDVTADLQGIEMEEIGEDRVRVTGVQGLPPPPTTKVGITAPAGYQCEWHFFMCGLDIEEKCRITEDQIRHSESCHT